MKKLILLLFVSFFTFAYSQVKWFTLEEAIEAQKENPKKILIDFYADWCGSCKIMDKKTYNHPEIAEYLNQNYYPVKFDAEARNEITIYGRSFGNPGYENKRRKNAMHELTQYMNVNAVPSMVFLDNVGNPITILQGALTARELEPYLHFFSNDEYTKIKTRVEWDNYQKKFKSKIRD